MSGLRDSGWDSELQEKLDEAFAEFCNQALKRQTEIVMSALEDLAQSIRRLTPILNELTAGLMALSISRSSIAIGDRGRTRRFDPRRRLVDVLGTLPGPDPRTFQSRLVRVRPIWLVSHRLRL